MKNSIKNYKLLLYSFDLFFVRQYRILAKEIHVLKQAVNYYIISQEKNGIKESQETEELKSILDGIKTLAEAYERDKEGNPLLSEHFLIKKIDKIDFISNNNHLTLLPIIDCIIDKFNILYEELNFYKHSYYNLIESKEFSYIPSPKFHKRFRNANIGLFLNEQLNDKTNNSYRSKLKEFYKINDLTTKEKLDIFDRKKFFATWDHSTNHQVKNFNRKNSDNFYITMSYIYLDKGILQSIAYHEIAHSIEIDDKKLPNFHFLENCLQQLFANQNKIISPNQLIQDLYKEVLCDLSAFYATGYSYIFSLIHIGFLEFNMKNRFDFKANKYDFYHDQIRCLRENEDIIPLVFDLNFNTIFITVRLLILLKICEQLNIKHDMLDGIRTMINLVFPENETDPNITTFESIYKFISPNAEDYQISKNLVYTFYYEFEKIFINRKILKNFKRNSKDHHYFNFSQEIYPEKFNYVKKYVTNFNSNCTYNFFDKTPLNIIDKETLVYMKKNKTIFDFAWNIRINNLLKLEKYNKNLNENQVTIQEKHIYRLFNIYRVLKNSINDVFLDNKKDFNDRFFDLYFIKYRHLKNFHPFIEFNKLEINQKNIGYILSPYDIVVLKKNIVDSEEKIQNVSPFEEDKEQFFLDRHSLFLLNEIDNGSNKSYFNLVVQIKISNIFSPQVNKTVYNKLLSFFKDKNNQYNLLSKYSKCEIFKSLGSEDYLLYIYDIDINEGNLFGKQLRDTLGSENIKNIEDHVVINKKITNEENLQLNDNKVNIFSFSKINSNHDLAGDFFNNSKNIENYLPSQHVKNRLLPTNRFDFIMQWKINEENKNPFKTIHNSIHKCYYLNDNNIFMDTNIEVMYTRD